MNDALSVLIYEPDQTRPEALRAWLRSAGFLVSDCPHVLNTATHSPDIVLLCLGRDPSEDLRVMASIQAAVPCARIVVLHDLDQETAVLETLRRGALAHLCRRGLAREELVAAVRLVASGEAVISPRIAGLMLDAVQETRRTR